MNLDVLIPSLLLPAPIHEMFPPPVIPALEKLLARAESKPEPAPSAAPWLCKRWGVAAPYPIAPLLAAYDGLNTTNEGWLLAEPVHLVPDRDRLTLFPGRSLALEAAETATLIGILNSHFADRHLQFFAPTTERWYVRCATAEIPDTTPPNVTRFGSLADFQPKSRGTLDWRSLQNEAQMLLFGHPINEAREAAGKPLVSGVWFWGGGVLPELKKPAYDRVVANPGLVTQLATMSEIDAQALSWHSVDSAQGNVLVVIESLAALASGQDNSAWNRELERLDHEWFLPISRALAKGAIERLSLYLPGPECAGSFHLTRRDQLLRFWRGAKPLSTYA